MPSLINFFGVIKSATNSPTIQMEVSCNTGMQVGSLKVSYYNKPKMHGLHENALVFVNGTYANGHVRALNISILEGDIVELQPAFMTVVGTIVESDRVEVSQYMNGKNEKSMITFSDERLHNNVKQYLAKDKQVVFSGNMIEGILVAAEVSFISSSSTAKTFSPSSKELRSPSKTAELKGQNLFSGSNSESDEKKESTRKRLRA